MKTLLVCSLAIVALAGCDSPYLRAQREARYRQERESKELVARVQANLEKESADALKRWKDAERTNRDVQILLSSPQKFEPITQ